MQYLDSISTLSSWEKTLYDEAVQFLSIEKLADCITALRSLFSSLENNLSVAKLTCYEPVKQT